MLIIPIIQVCDFIDGITFRNLESVLVQLNPREVVLPQSEHPGLKKIQQILERNRILVTPKPNTEFTPLVESEIKRLLNPKTMIGSLSENPVSSSACSAVLKYLGLHTESGDANLFR